MRDKFIGVSVGYLPSGEIDKVVFIVGEEFYFKGIAKGAQKSKKRFGFSLEPFSLSEFLVYRKNETSTPVVENACLIFRDDKIFLSYEYSAVFLSISEIIINTLEPGAQTSKLFRLLNALLRVSREEGEAINIFLYFFYWFLRLEGIFEGKPVCGKCRNRIEGAGFLSLKTNEIFCTPHRDEKSIPIGKEFLIFLRNASKLSPVEFIKLKIKEKSNLVLPLYSILSFYLQKELKGRKMLMELLN